MATLYSDDFNRTADPTNVGSPLVGGPYTERIGTTWGVSGTGLYTSTSVSDAMITFPSAIDCDFQSTLAVSADCGIMTRWVDTNNLWLLSNSVGSVRLYRKTAGAYVVRMGPYTVPSFPTILRIVTQGVLVSAFVGGIQIGVTEDESYLSATAISGYRSHSNTAARFDDALAIDSAALSTSAGTVTDTLDINRGSAVVGWPSHVFKGGDKKALDTVGIA